MSWRNGSKKHSVPTDNVGVRQGKAGSIQEGDMEALASFAQALAQASVRIVDLSQPLSERTPVIRLPKPS